MSDISAVSSNNGVTSLYTDSDRATVSQSEFLAILVAQLSCQDPMEPMSNADLAQQISAIQSLQNNNDMVDAIEGLVRQQQISSAGNLIGKYIRAADGDGGQVEGIVESVAIDRTGVYLRVGQDLIPQGNVFEVLPEAPEPPEGDEGESSE